MQSGAVQLGRFNLGWRRFIPKRTRPSLRFEARPYLARWMGEVDTNMVLAGTKRVSQVVSPFGRRQLNYWKLSDENSQRAT